MAAWTAEEDHADVGLPADNAFSYLGQLHYQVEIQKMVFYMVCGIDEADDSMTALCFIMRFIVITNGGIKKLNCRTSYRRRCCCGGSSKRQCFLISGYSQSSSRGAVES